MFSRYKENTYMWLLNHLKWLNHCADSMHASLYTTNQHHCSIQSRLVADQILGITCGMPQ